MHSFTKTVAEYAYTLSAHYDITYQKGVVSALHYGDPNLENCDDVTAIYQYAD